MPAPVASPFEKIEFVKMEGCGNDYIFLDCFAGGVPRDPAGLARILSDRHVGIGGDGLVLVLFSQKADVRMRIWNADGSEAEMCGNAIRCVGKLAYERGLATSNPMTVETAAGIRTLELSVRDGQVSCARVHMGSASFDPARLPAEAERYDFVRHPSGVWQGTLEADGETLAVSLCSMGNPHAVVHVRDTDRFPVTRIGPLLERHPCFPRRANIGFAQVAGPDAIRLRVWERGSGETLACGTGACAAAAVSAALGLCGRKVDVTLPGGTLRIETPREGPVHMTGPCRTAFEGTVRVPPAEDLSRESQ